MDKFRYIDSHVNLHAPQFDEDRDKVIERAFDAGVGLMLNICDRVSNFPSVLQIAQSRKNIWATVGTHPHEAKENPNLKVDELVALSQHEKVVGIGECGLDFYYDLSPREIQEKIFRVHIIAARESNLPLVIHTRDADETIWPIIESEFKARPFRFLLHCYTSGLELAQKAADLGAYFSVSGIASFKAAEDVRKVIEFMPENRILIETDCPYLAPVPMRGRRNEPSYVPYVYETLAKIKNWTIEETRTKTHKAFFEFFNKINVE
jgi:TatD DNase family protein